MKPITNVSASVRQRLLNLTNATRQDPNRVWVRYGTERLLYRLSVSEHADSFVLKGAMLFLVWSDHPHRPTRDLDLGVRGSWSAERIASLFRALCVLDVEPDGLRFDAESVAITDIRRQQRYPGWRVTLTAYLETVRIPLQVDIGFGDAIVPEPEVIGFPTLLDFPAPRLRAYPVETTIAEKLHALVELGVRTSRMKDLFDLFTIVRQFALDASTLRAALMSTFGRRDTALPEVLPEVLAERAATDEAKQTQWKAFLRKSDLSTAEADLESVLAVLREFAEPLLEMARGLDAHLVPGSQWPPGGPWQAPEADTTA